MTDRFDEPERSPAGDSRRVFIPAPASAPASTGTPRGRAAPPPPPRPARGPDGPGGPGGSPPAAPARAPRSGDSWFRRVRWRRVVLVVVVLLVVGLVGSFLYARSIFDRIERVEVSESLTSSSSGTNYLIVGSDSRENVTEQGDAGFNGAEAPTGQRADTMLLLHLEGGRAQMMSIPRDLYVPIAGTDGSSKINAAYNADLGGGPRRLIDTVSEYLDIPIDRYMEVDFVSFAGLVDALGGITIEFEHPAQDPASGLLVPEAGLVELDGDQALAFVRSRNYTETINGEQVTDPTADLGRIVRQQQFLSAVIAELSDTKNPFTLASAAGGMAEGLRIDDEMTFFDALRLGWGMRGKTPEVLEPLPVSNDRNEAGAVLILDEAAAQPILDQVR